MNLTVIKLWLLITTWSDGTTTQWPKPFATLEACSEEMPRTHEFMGVQLDRPPPRVVSRACVESEWVRK